MADLIHAINARDTSNTLIHVLETYRTARAKKAETYHSTIFKPFTKSEKMEAVEKLTLRLQGTNVDLTARNIAALKQGALGNSLKLFIIEYGNSLAKSLNAKKGISNIDDLISATSSSSTPKPTA